MMSMNQTFPLTAYNFSYFCTCAVYDPDDTPQNHYFFSKYLALIVFFVIFIAIDFIDTIFDKKVCMGKFTACNLALLHFVGIIYPEFMVWNDIYFLLGNLLFIIRLIGLVLSATPWRFHSSTFSWVNQMTCILLYSLIMIIFTTRNFDALGELGGVLFALCMGIYGRSISLRDEEARALHLQQQFNLFRNRARANLILDQVSTIRDVPSNEPVTDCENTNVEPVSATHRYKSRDKAITPYNYAGARIFVAVYDDYSYQIVKSKNRRWIGKLKGRTLVELLDGRSFTLNYPLIDVTVREARNWLSIYIPDSKALLVYDDVSAITKDAICSLLMGCYPLGKLVSLIDSVVSWCSSKIWIMVPLFLIYNAFSTFSVRFKKYAPKFLPHDTTFTEYSILIAPFFEEILKSHWIPGYIFAIGECIEKDTKTKEQFALSLIPLVAHILSLGYSYPFRVCGHVFWNAFWFLIFRSGIADKIYFYLYPPTFTMGDDIIPNPNHWVVHGPEDVPELEPFDGFIHGMEIQHSEFGDLYLTIQLTPQNCIAATYFPYQIDPRLAHRVCYVSENEVLEGSVFVDERLAARSRSKPLTLQQYQTLLVEFTAWSETIDLKGLDLMSQAFKVAENQPNFVCDPFDDALYNVFENEVVLLSSKLYSLYAAFEHEDAYQFIALMVSYNMVAPLFDLIRSLAPVKDYNDFKEVLVQFFNDFKKSFTSPEEPSSMLYKVFNKLATLFPQEIKASPTLKCLFTFFVTLVGSFFFKDTNVFQNAMKTLSFSSFINPSNLVESVLGILDGLVAAFQSGDWRDFFREPESVKLRKDLDVYFLQEHYLSTELEQALEEGLKLQTRMHYSSDPAVQKHSAFLSSKIRLIKETIEDCKGRKPPIIVWSVGTPGTGKTVSKNNLVNAYALTTGRPIDPRLVGEIDLNVKFPAEKVDPNSIVLFINELRADFSQDLVNGFIPTEIYLQRIADNCCLLRFQQAEVRFKGVAFNKVELVFIASNPFCHKFGDDISKMQRRFSEYFIVVNQELVDFSNEGFKILENTNIPNVRPHIHFRRIKPVINLQYLSHTVDPCSDWVSMPQFLDYFMDRVRTTIENSSNLDKAVSSKCPCGIPINAHFHGADFHSFSELCVPVSPADYIKPPTCDCGVSDKYHRSTYDGIHWSTDHYRIAKVNNGTYDGIVYNQSNKKTYVLTDLKVKTVEELEEEVRRYEESMAKKKKAVFTSNDYVVGGVLSLILSFLVLICIRFKRRYDALFSSTEESVSRILAIMPEIDKAVKTTNVYFVKLSDFETKFHAQIDYFMKAAKKYFPPLLLFAGAKVLYNLYKSKEASLTAGPILRSDLIAGTMHFDSITKEVKYSPELQEKWKKPAGTINRAVFTINNVEAQHLQSKLKANYKFQMQYSKDAATSGYLVKLNEQYILMNAHYMRNLKPGASAHMTVFDDDNKIIGSFTMSIADVRQVYHDVSATDNIVVKATLNGVPGQDIIKYFVEDIGDIKNFSGCVNKANYGSRSNFIILDSVDITNNVENSDVVVLTDCWERHEQGDMGECGKLAYGDFGKTNCIIGTVSYSLLGAAKQGGNLLFQKDIIAAIESFGLPYVNQIVFTAIDVLPLADNSSMREISNRCIMPIGTSPGPASTFQTRLRPSILHSMTEPFCSKKFSVPKNPKAFVEGEWYSTYAHTFKSMPENVIYSSTHLFIACETIKEYFYNEINKKYPGVELSPLSLEDAFFGDERQLIDRCNFKSAMGPTKIGSAKTRADLFVSEDGKLRFDQNFLKEFKEFYDDVLQGKLRAIFVSGSIKDEIRTEEKVKFANLRMFFTVCIFWNTLCKMFVGPIRAFLLRIPEISKCFGQINSSSVQWDELAKYLHLDDLDWFLLDEDFSKFDVSHRELICKVAEIFYFLGKMLYKDEDAASICYYCIFILLIQIFKFNRDYALKVAGMPSGYDATLIINSLVNLILMVYCWAVLMTPKYTCMDFFSLVKPSTVGDDNLSGVHSSVANEFNVVTMAPLLKSIGYNVTNGDKAEILRPFVSKETARFLKRAFRFDSEIKRYMPAIEEDTIWKMLSFYEDKGREGVPENEICATNIDVAQREFFFFGREVFEDRKLILQEIARVHYLSCRWHDYEDLKSKFINNEYEMNWI